MAGGGNRDAAARLAADRVRRQRLAPQTGFRAEFALAKAALPPGAVPRRGSREGGGTFLVDSVSWRGRRVPERQRGCAGHLQGRRNARRPGRRLPGARLHAGARTVGDSTARKVRLPKGLNVLAIEVHRSAQPESAVKMVDRSIAFDSGTCGVADVKLTAASGDEVASNVTRRRDSRCGTAICWSPTSRPTTATRTSRSAQSASWRRGGAGLRQGSRRLEVRHQRSRGHGVGSYSQGGQGTDRGLGHPDRIRSGQQLRLGRRLRPARNVAILLRRPVGNRGAHTSGWRPFGLDAVRRECRGKRPSLGG